MIYLNSLGTVNLRTRNCLLRRFELRDAINVYNSYSSIESVSKYLTNNVHQSIFETEYMIYEFMRNYNNSYYYNWIIEDIVNKNIIGTISLHEIDLYIDKAEIGIIISPFYQKKGFAKEVIKKIIEFAFNNLNINRLEAKVFINNLSSNKLFKSIGFKYEGVIHSIAKKNNQFFDVNLYYLLKGDYYL